MTGPIHIILGGNGVVGRETVCALARRGIQPISVGRRPTTEPGAASAEVDLLDAVDTSRALTGAGVVYFVPGLPYDSRVWQRQWTRMLRNAIDASLTTGARLVYLDNVYVYGRVERPMTEASPIEPVSAKGRVRAEALDLLDAARSRGVDVVIARSADFYGPGAGTSVFNTFALDKIAAGKPPVWLFDADQPHSLTYTPDIGEALAILGRADVPSGSVWHVPTAPALTGNDYLRLAGATRTSVMSSATMRIGSLFNRAARETLEMSYQYTAPYVFDSTKFTGAFRFEATATPTGIAASLQAATVSSGG